MIKDIVVLASDASVADAQEVLFRCGADSAPVIDAEGALVGIVSVDDCMGRMEGTVAEVMDGYAIWASETTSVEEIASLMLDWMVRKIIIVRGDLIVGMVDARDIVRAFLDRTSLPVVHATRAGWRLGSSRLH